MRDIGDKILTRTVHCPDTGQHLVERCCDLHSFGVIRYRYCLILISVSDVFNGMSNSHERPDEDACKNVAENKHDK